MSLFEAAIQGSVNVSLGGPNSSNYKSTSISATFTPNFGLSLQQTASLEGYTGFDWMQVMDWPTPNLYSTLSPTKPYYGTNISDPAPGGFVNTKPYPNNSSYPYYYDPRGPKSNDWSVAARSPDGLTLNYYDQPANPALTPGQSEVFYTTLVGVTCDANSVCTNGPPLFRVLWTSTYVPCIFHISDLYVYGGDTGGVAYAEADADDSSGQGVGGVQILSEEYFPTAGAPEESTCGMLIIGLLVCGFLANKRKAARFSFRNGEIRIGWPHGTNPRGAKIWEA
jgi:hypothetical protein